MGRWGEGEAGLKWVKIKDDGGDLLSYFLLALLRLHLSPSLALSLARSLGIER
jgi:hypothetical protein